MFLILSEKFYSKKYGKELIFVKTVFLKTFLVIEIKKNKKQKKLLEENQKKNIIIFFNTRIQINYLNFKAKLS